jgi:hypothetical protein
MKPAEKAAHALKSWLKTAEGFDYILKLTAHYSRDCLQDSTLMTYLGNRFSCDPVELRQEIAQEFLEFLLTSFLSKLNRRPDQVTMILSDQVSKVLRFALKQFAWNLKDLARQKDTNPRAYLYRRIREILDHDQNFLLHKNLQNILAYSPADGSCEFRMDQAVFADLDYSDLPVPPALDKGRNSLFTAKYLAPAALFFQQETSRQLHGNYAIPLRELVRYLAVFYPWINRNHPDPLENAPDRSENIKTAEEQFDQITALDSISALAAQFSLGLNEQSCKIFVWRLDDPPVSLEEIARRLDISDHNRVYRIHEKTITALKKFTSSWPGPPLEELPEDVGLAFIEAIKNICEKSVH